MPHAHKPVLSVLVGCCTLVLLSALALAQDGNPNAKCTFIPLKITTPPGSTTASPADINDVGAIVGSFSDANSNGRAFLFYRGKFTAFNFPGAMSTFALDISNNAKVVGWFDRADGVPRPYAVAGGAFREIQLPGFPNVPAEAHGVNSFGHVVGRFAVNAVSRGFLLRNGKLTVLAFPGAVATFAENINNSDVVVGFYQPSFSNPFVRAFMWRAGKYTDISFPGAVGSSAVKINDRNDVVGVYNDVNRQTHGFSYDNGRFATIDVPVANPSGPPTTVLLGVNNKDQVVAESVTPTQSSFNLGECSAVF